MSSVLTCVLTFDLTEDEAYVVDELNRLLDEHERARPGFVLVEASKSGKAMQQYVAVAALNYVSVEDLIEHLGQLPWRDPKHVRLLACREEEDAMSLYSL